MVENMAVPYVTRPVRWVKRECVLPGKQVCLLHLLRCQADPDSSDHSVRCEEDVLPPALLRRGRYRYTRREWGTVVGAVLRVEQESTRRARRSGTETWIKLEAHRDLRIDSDRWVIKRKFARYAIGVHVELLPIGLEAVDVDKLPVL